MLHQYFDMVTAKNYEAFTSAMKRLQVPTFNISYADRDGNIEYVFNGIRRSARRATWRSGAASCPAIPPNTCGPRCIRTKSCRA